MHHPYYDCVHLIERLHRQFLDLLKVELDRNGIQDINNVQALILYNVGEDEMTVGELTARGYYLGSNVSYNLKKMVEAGYLTQERSLHDRRSIRVKVSAKGKDLNNKMLALIERHIEKLKGIGFTAENFKPLSETLRRMERFWEGQLSFATAPFNSNVA